MISLSVLLHWFISWRIDRREGPIVAAGAAVLMGLLVSLTSSMSATVINVAVPLVFCVGFLDGFQVSAMSTLRQAGAVTAVVLVSIMAALSLESSMVSTLLSGLVFGGLIASLAATGPQHIGRTSEPIPWGPTGARLGLAMVTPVMLFVVLHKEIPGSGERALTATLLTVGTMVTFGLSRALARWLDPRLQFLRVLARYLRVMAVPLGGFTLGYLAIVVVFAGLFATVARLSPDSFVGMPAGTDFTEWFYLSLATATTLGYGDLAPVTLLAKILVGLEGILATGWLVAVFGAVTAYLQPQMTRLNEVDADGEMGDVDDSDR